MDAQLIQRVATMEGHQEQILTILHQIESRLVGDLAEDKPGLIDEVRALRKIIESVDNKIVTLDARMIALEKVNTQTQIDELKIQVKTLQKQVEVLNKYRLMVYGAILVVAFFSSKAWDFFLSKIK